jgi:hypothetical protein
MDKYKYLILVEWDEAPFLVLADSAPPKEGFVAFHDGNEMRLGEIVKSCFISEDGDEYCMFSALYTIFDAVKMYGCCYEKEDCDG